MGNLITISQFDSLAANASSQTASVAAAASAAIQELAEAVLPDSNTIVITASTIEPDNDEYWLQIEEVVDE